MQNTQDMNSLRYAQMQSSIFNKSSTSSSSSNFKTNNLKGKFSSYEEALAIIETETHNLVEETQTSLRKCGQIKSHIGQNSMQQYKRLCEEQIKKMEKNFLYCKLQSEKRTQQLWKQSKNLSMGTQHLKSLSKEIQNRIQNLEHTLGFYNGNDRIQSF